MAEVDTGEHTVELDTVGVVDDFLYYFDVALFVAHDFLQLVEVVVVVSVPQDGLRVLPDCGAQFFRVYVHFGAVIVHGHVLDDLVALVEFL